MDKIIKLKFKNSCMALRSNYLCISTSTTLTLYDVASGSVINSIRAKRSFGYLEFLSDEIILVECSSEYRVAYHLPDFELISKTRKYETIWPGCYPLSDGIHYIYHYSFVDKTIEFKKMALNSRLKVDTIGGDSPYEIPLREKGLPFRISKFFYDNSRDHGVAVITYLNEGDIYENFAWCEFNKSGLLKSEPLDRNDYRAYLEGGFWDDDIQYYVCSHIPPEVSERKVMLYNSKENKWSAIAPILSLFFLFKINCSLKKKYVLLEFLGPYGNITVQVINYEDLSTIKKCTFRNAVNFRVQEDKILLSTSKGSYVMDMDTFMETDEDLRDL